MVSPYRTRGALASEAPAPGPLSAPAARPAGLPGGGSGAPAMDAPVASPAGIRPGSGRDGPTLRPFNGNTDPLCCGRPSTCATVDSAGETVPANRTPADAGMADTLTDQFRAFELLDDDEPMRGFHRILRCSLRDWERLYEHEAFGFEQPFDVRFAKAMVKTLSFLVGTDEELEYGFAEHAELSLLLNGTDAPEAEAESEAEAGAEPTTARGVVCRVASGAASRLSLVLGDMTRFDVRLYQFPSAELAKTFFLWRQQCQRRASLDRHVAHLLVKNGQELDVVRGMVADFGEEEKLEILTQHEVSFEDLPIWQRRGASCYWRKSGDAPPALTVDTTLPVGDQYTDYLGRFL